MIARSSIWLGCLTIVPAFAGEQVADASKAMTAITESTLSSSHLIDTAAGLIAVLALMLALAWLVKRYVQVPGMGKGQIKILGGISLGPRERAVLISVGGERVLLGVAPGRVQTLHVLQKTDSEEPAGEAGFGELLSDAKEDRQ